MRGGGGREARAGGWWRAVNPLVALAGEIVTEIVTALAQPAPDLEAERQALMTIQRKISDELERRELAAAQ